MREDARKRKLLAARGERQGNETEFWQTEITTGRFGPGGWTEKPYRNASSRILGRVLERTSWNPGGAFKAEPLGPFEIAAMRFQALGLASFQATPRGTQGIGGRSD